MDPENNKNGGNGSAGTGGDDPAATPTPKDPPASTFDPAKLDLPEGYEVVRTEDVKKLKSNGDKRFEELRQTQGVVSALVQKDAIRDAMKTSDFQEKFPDVSFDDILERDPGSEKEILEFAETVQKRFNKIKIDATAKVQRATVPTISAQDMESQQAELKKPSVKSRFGAALRLQRTQVK